MDIDKMIQLIEMEWSLRKNHHPIYIPKNIRDEIDKLEYEQFKLFDNRYPDCPRNQIEWKLRYNIQDKVRIMKNKYFK